MKITVNGKEEFVRLSYEELVARADKDPSRVYTITWRDRAGTFSGTVTPGQAVELFDGLDFSVSDTSCA